jgi:hypothetical protein
MVVAASATGWRSLAPAAEELGPYLGPQISSGFPETLSALVERAEP